MKNAHTLPIDGITWHVIKYNYSLDHRRTFRGAEVSCPNILSIACPKSNRFARI